MYSTNCQNSEDLTVLGSTNIS